jgi:hypothetical protein
VVPLHAIEALWVRGGIALLISALEGGEWSASRPGRTLPPGKEPPVPIVQEAGWAPEPVWTQRLEEKSSASVVDRRLAVQSVVNTLYWPSYPGFKIEIVDMCICMYAYSTRRDKTICTKLGMLIPWAPEENIRTSSGKLSGVRVSVKTISVLGN